MQLIYTAILLDSPDFPFFTWILTTRHQSFQEFFRLLEGIFFIEHPHTTVPLHIYQLGSLQVLSIVVAYKQLLHAEEMGLEVPIGPFYIRAKRTKFTYAVTSRRLSSGKGRIELTRSSLL